MRRYAPARYSGCRRLQSAGPPLLCARCFWLYLPSPIFYSQLFSRPLNRPAAEETAAEEASAEEPAAEEATAEKTPDAAGADAAGADDPKAEVEALRTELESLEEEQAATNDRLMRAAAELQNVRRRAAEEQQRRTASAKAAALRPMLEVLDDLQRALASASAEEQGAQETAGETGKGTREEKRGAAFQSLYDGVQMVADKFERALAGVGVEPIEAEGQPFDEAKHEAMMRQPAPEGTAPGTVLAEIRRGYRMETSGEARVLRHSRVVVASDPPGASAGGEDAEESTSAEK